ncbi:hypothetical protein ACT5YR_07670 [Fructobacillus fructosus]
MKKEDEEFYKIPNWVSVIASVIGGLIGSLTTTFLMYVFSK